MLPLQRTMNFENVLVGKPNQIKKSFTQLWLLVIFEHSSSSSLRSFCGALSLRLHCSSRVSGFRVQCADGFGDRSNGRADLMVYVSVWVLHIEMASLVPGNGTCCGVRLSGQWSYLALIWGFSYWIDWCYYFPPFKIVFTTLWAHWMLNVKAPFSGRIWMTKFNLFYLLF